MAAAALRYDFGESVPKVGVIGGQRTVLHGLPESAGTRPACALQTFVSENSVLVLNPTAAVNPKSCSMIVTLNITLFLTQRQPQP